MLAKILIRRRFKDGNTPQIIKLLNDLRGLALSQQGYQSGETLMKHGSPNEMVVISTWNTMDDWYRWRENPERKNFEDMLELYQEKPTQYEEFLLGSPLQAKTP